MTCTCARLSVGGGLNWNPDCAQHGLGSEWWRSPEQVAKRTAQVERSRSLQAQAKAARRAAGR